MIITRFLLTALLVFTPSVLSDVIEDIVFDGKISKLILFQQPLSVLSTTYVTMAAIFLSLIPMVMCLQTPVFVLMWLLEPIVQSAQICSSLFMKICWLILASILLSVFVE